MENENIISIFTDGSSLGNPGPGGFGAIVVFDGKVKELGGGEKPTTNNRMELSAAIGALQWVGRNVSDGVGDPRPAIVLHTDSSYVINGITKWIWGWKKNNWITSTKTEVINRNLWEELSKVVIGKKIEWKYVAGHVSVAGNERADRIAVSFAEGKPETLFEGNFSDYPIKNILDISHDVEQKKDRSESRAHSKAKAYSYVSLVDGKIMTHQTWAECEARVKGKKAKYKKAVSKEDEG
ncbi:MAG: ribonuclease HI, partial [Candidatus Paceibacterota bacterium]